MSSPTIEILAILDQQFEQVSLAEYESPAYPADRLPPELAKIPAVKPGSRNI